MISGSRLRYQLRGGDQRVGRQQESWTSRPLSFATRDNAAYSCDHSVQKTLVQKASAIKLQTPSVARVGSSLQSRLSRVARTPSARNPFLSGLELSASSQIQLRCKFSTNSLIKQRAIETPKPDWKNRVVVGGFTSETRVMNNQIKMVEHEVTWVR